MICGHGAARVALLVLAALLAAVPFTPLAQACPADAPAIRVVAHTSQARIDLRRNAQQMAAMGVDDRIVDPEFSALAGLTDATIAVDSEVRTVIRTPKARGTGEPICVLLDAIEVTISTAPVVYVDASRGACQVRAALEHERKHVATDEAIVARFLPILQRQLADQIRAIPPSAAGSTAEAIAAQGRLETRANAIIAADGDALLAARDAVQRSLDTSEDYQQVSDSCP